MLILGVKLTLTLGVTLIVGVKLTLIEGVAVGVTGGTHPPHGSFA